MISRRMFGASLGAGAIGALTPRLALAEPADVTFPAGFKWGCATAAYQIEGAVAEDGRGKSIWDVFSHTPGKVANGDTGDVATDSYHRYKEDTQLLKNLGAGAYRFSIAWPRIFPEGRGKPNQKGVDHYDRVVDNLLENGIDPYVTLFHWDLPAALPGGWQSRDTAQAFADYAGFMAGKLSDRVDHFITTNEFRSFIDGGYLGGLHAPGLRVGVTALRQIAHHALLAHGLGVQAIRAKAKRPVQIGFAENASSPVPVVDTPENVDAARRAMRLLNAPYLPTILEGRYPDEYWKSGADLVVKDGDMSAIGSPLDFLALNVYSPIYVRAAPETPRGFAIVSPSPTFPRMGLSWLLVGPESAYWSVRLASEVWKPKAIYISENGCAAGDRLVNGAVNDIDRVMYLRNYLSQLARAGAEGFPLKGYFLWSLLDNFEWAEGYSARFGIHYVDFATQQRTPKLSAAFYREVIRRNAVV